jgi:lysophospholipase L1-like esterase
VAKQDNLWIRGFLGVPGVATPGHFRELRPSTIPSEYIEDHEPLYARLQEAVDRQRKRGTEVVFVRLPIAPIPRQLEDAAGFDRDIRSAAARFGVRYIDGRVLMGDAFSNDRSNFADGGHLNASGATRFSHVLADVLRSSNEPPVSR